MLFWYNLLIKEQNVLFSLTEKLPDKASDVLIPANFPWHNSTDWVKA